MIIVVVMDVVGRSGAGVDEWGVVDIDDFGFDVEAEKLYPPCEDLVS